MFKTDVFVYVYGRKSTINLFVNNTKPYLFSHKVSHYCHAFTNKCAYIQ
jgi:hypothetical protein